MRGTSGGKKCIVYTQVPHLGGGWVQICVSILEHFPADILSATLVIPRAFQAISPAVDVVQAIPYPIPYRSASRIARPALDYSFRRTLASHDPRNTVVYFWPKPSLSLVREARKLGFLTVREAINTCLKTAKVILEDAYDRLSLQLAHPITDDMVRKERDELELYDYVFSPSPRVTKSLIETGIDSNRILPSTYGWSPAKFASSTRAENKQGFRALFVGTICVRKGVPQLLEAWKKSGVSGELLLVGDVEPALQRLLKPYLNDHGVKLAGFNLNLGPIYKSADLFVFPSLEEGDPLVTYEAAGCGLPIIATPMGGANILRDGVNGLLVQPYDIDGLAQAISRLANSSELRNRFARQAASDALSYTTAKIGNERARRLSDLLNSRR